MQKRVMPECVIMGGMKIARTSIFLSAAAALFGAGCSTMYDGFGTYGQDRANAQSQRDQARLREQMERIQLQQDAGSALSAARDAESRLNQLDLRLERLEAASRNLSSYASLSDLEALRRENESLRAQLAETKASQEKMRSEILSNVKGLLKEQQSRAASSAAAAAVTKAVSGYEHKVEAGQTLSAIASAYGVSVKKIMDANKLKSDAIRVGQVLFIPD